MSMARESGPTQAGERRGGDRGLAFALIAAGLVWIGFQSGVLRWESLWSLTRVWPVVVVAVGVDLLTRGRYRIPLAIVTLVVVAATWRFGVPGGWWGVGVTQHPVEVPLGEAASAQLSFVHGVGRFDLGTLAGDDDTLLRGRVDLPSHERFDLRTGGDAQRVTVAVAARGGGGPSVVSDDRLRWSLDVTRQIPLDLDVDAGVGSSTLDLRLARLSTLEVDAGVGRVDMTLPERGGYRVEVSAGVGEIVVHVPSTLAVRLDVDTGLGGVDVRGAWIREGTTYLTSAWAAAPPAERVEVSIDGGIGRVVVRHVD